MRTRINAINPVALTAILFTLIVLAGLIVLSTTGVGQGGPPSLASGGPKAMSTSLPGAAPALPPPGNTKPGGMPLPTPGNPTPAGGMTLPAPPGGH